MRDDDREALKEALDDPRLRRILDVWLNAVQKRGQPPARLKIESPHEADALQGLIGGKLIRAKSISAAEIKERLARYSRFKCNIRQLVEIRFGKIVSRPEVRRQADSEWTEAWARLQEVACRSAPADLCRRVFHWMEAERRELLRRYRRQGLPALERDLKAVVNALAALPEQGRFLLLAQLAEEASRDPHAFDADKPAGSLLDRALAHWFPEAASGPRRSARWRRRLLAAAGIQRDSISSRVDTFGVLVGSSTPPPPDPDGLDRTWTLRALIRARGRLHAAHGVVWVFENPTVFEAVMDLLEGHPRDFDPTLVCTNGRLNHADEALLDGLVANDAQIFYSGDFDTDGLQIALNVLARYPGRAQLWHMEARDYRSIPHDPLRKLRWKSLPRIRTALPELVAAMEASGHPASQESLIRVLFEDIARFTRTRTAASAPARKR